MSQPNQSVIITGTGSYTPANVLTNDDMSKIVDTSDEWIRTRSGISERCFAAEGETTSDMAVAAAEKAILAAGIDRKDIDLIIVATMTPDMPFPSTACILQSKLGLGNISAFDIQAACSGFIYALNTGCNMLRSGTYKKALIIGAASAIIIEATDRAEVGVLGSITGSDGSDPSLLHQPAGGSKIPSSHESIDARQHFIKMNGKEIFKQAVRVMGQVSNDILEQYSLKADQIDLVIPHQANMRIIESLAKRMKLPMEKFHNNLDRFGNTSAASIGLALDEAYRKGRIQSGDLILLVAFGAGLTWGASLIKWQ
jgi:3-oxoacyl-[acyl-carrier-protein] synthase-3